MINKFYLKLHNIFHNIANFFWKKAIRDFEKERAHNDTNKKTKKVTKKTTRGNFKKTKKR